MGQIVDLKFSALEEGRMNVQVGCYSDCWIGCDKVLPLKFAIKKATKVRASQPARVVHSEPEEEDVLGNDEAKEDAKSGSEEEERDQESGSDEYDSEETGELETGSDEEQNETEATN